MAQCVRCGRKGLLLKVDLNCHCPECAEAYRAEVRERQRLQEEINQKKAMVRLLSIPCFDIWISDVNRKRRRGYEEVKTSNITPKGTYDQFVVFDTETTGLAPSRDRIIEIGAVRFIDYVPVERFTVLVNPERPIPPDASAVNGITDDMVAYAPTISQVLPAFEEFIGSDTLVAHNLQFDLKFMFYSGSNLFDYKRKYIDTLEQAQRMLRRPRRVYDPDTDSWGPDYYSDYDVEDHKLDTLCDYYNIRRAQEHRADADALATGDLFLQLVAEKQG